MKRASLGKVLIGSIGIRLFTCILPNWHIYPALIVMMALITIRRALLANWELKAMDRGTMDVKEICRLSGEFQNASAVNSRVSSTLKHMQDQLVGLSVSDELPETISRMCSQCVQYHAR